MFCDLPNFLKTVHNVTIQAKLQLNNNLQMFLTINQIIVFSAEINKTSVAHVITILSTPNSLN